VLAKFEPLGQGHVEQIGPGRMVGLCHAASLALRPPRFARAGARVGELLAAGHRVTGVTRSARGRELLESLGALSPTVLAAGAWLAAVPA